MEYGIGWIVAFIAVAAVAWVIFRPRADRSGAVREALERGARVVDVRTPAEFAQGHVDGAANIPVDRLEGALDKLGPRDGAVVVYCRSGARSARARRILEAAGFQDVTDGGAMGNVTAAR